MSMSHTGEHAHRTGHERRRRRLRCQRGLVLVLGAALLVHLVSSATALGGRAAFERTMQAWHGSAPWSTGLRWGLVYIPLVAHVGYRLLDTLRRLRRAASRGGRVIAPQTWVGAAALAYLVWHTGHFVGDAGAPVPAFGLYDRLSAQLSSTTAWGFPAVAMAHLAGVACSVAYIGLALRIRRTRSPARVALTGAGLLALSAGWTTVLHFATGWPTW